MIQLYSTDRDVVWFSIVLGMGPRFCTLHDQELPTQWCVKLFQNVLPEMHDSLKEPYNKENKTAAITSHLPNTGNLLTVCRNTLTVTIDC